MIYIGTDEGIYRWVDKTFWPAYHSLQDHGIVSMACPATGLLAVVDNAGRILESENNGIDWREIPAPPGIGCRPLGVAAGAALGSIVLMTRPIGLYQREVGAPIPEPAEVSSAPRILKRLFHQARGGFGATAVADSESEPAPEIQAWSPLQVPQVERQGPSPVIRALSVGLGENAAWYAAVTGAGVWRSDDGSQSWQRCPGLPAEVYAIRIVAVPKETVAVATSDGCWVSADRGQTWEDRSGGLEQARQLRALEVHPEDPNSMLAGAAPALPADGSPAPRRGVRFSLYETSDGGKSWKHVRRGFPEVLEFDTISDICYDPAATENAIVALDSGELWRTRNGGDWWEPIARQIQAARVLCAVR
jgi:Sortilin, neurotensin receptor 3,